MIILDIRIEQRPAFTERPIAGSKAAGCFAEHLHSGRGFFVVAFDLSAPEDPLNTHGARQRGFFLEAHTVKEGDVLAAPIFFETFRSAEIDSGPLANHKSLAAELADVALDV